MLYSLSCGVLERQYLRNENFMNCENVHEQHRISGEDIGRYYVGKMELGHGGTSRVFDGHDGLTGQNYAYKLFISPGNVCNWELTSQVRWEAHCMARAGRAATNHVPRVHAIIHNVYLGCNAALTSAGSTEIPRSVIVMERIQGGTVTDYKIENKAERSDLDMIVKFGGELYGAVDGIHRSGLVHRDIKPDNIMCVMRGERMHPYIIDFGLAQDSRNPMSGPCGTPNTAAPEMYCRDETALPESDIFSAACVIYHLLYGEDLLASRNRADGDYFFRTHQGPNYERFLRDRMAKQPCASKLQGAWNDLRSILIRCLQYSYRDRPQSAENVARDLRHIEQKHFQSRSWINQGATR